MPTQPCSQYFFPNAERLVGEESQLIALRQERSPGNKFDVHKDHGETLSYQQCVNVFKTFSTSKVGLAYIENSAISLQKKIDINLRARLCSGHYAFHNSVSLTRLQLPVLNSCLLFRLVYCPSNFQIVAIALMSLVKDTFCLQLGQSNSKLVWLASKKE